EPFEERDDQPPSRPNGLPFPDIHGKKDGEECHSVSGFDLISFRELAQCRSLFLPKRSVGRDREGTTLLGEDQRLDRKLPEARGKHLLLDLTVGEECPQRLIDVGRSTPIIAVLLVRYLGDEAVRLEFLQRRGGFLRGYRGRRRLALRRLLVRRGR